MTYDVWVDDFNIDNDGNVFTLAKFARPGVDPQVGDTVLVSDAELPARAARVLERSSNGVLILSLSGTPGRRR